MNKYAKFSKAEKRREARESLYEHNQEKTQAINRQIITKGTPLPTDKQVKMMSGEVITTFIPKPITFDTFKKFNADQKKAWLVSIYNEYKGVNASAISKMWGGHYTLIRDAVVELGLSKGQGNQGVFTDRARFERDMQITVEDVNPLGNTVTAATESNPNYTTECNSADAEMLVIPSVPIVSEPTPMVKGAVISAILECDAEDLPTVIQQLGLSGKIRANISQIRDVAAGKM